MIGIFDSGSGGLTVLREIKNRMPSSNILYFGDILNAPYGGKTHEELSALTMKAVSLLHARGARSIVSACNSTSAALAVSLFDALGMDSIRLIEMVGPTVAHLRHSKERILVCATPATCRSGIYTDAFTLAGKKVDVLPIPDLAGAIEFNEGDARVRACIEHAFAHIDMRAYEAVLLACTHYPLAFSHFREVLGETMIILDPAILVAERVEKEFWPREAGEGEMHFLVSADSTHFRTLVGTLFPNARYTVEVLE